MESTANRAGWKLEVIRGTDAGRGFALGAGEVVLGNAPGGLGGLDLSTQEAESSLRRMAARHALLECSSAGLTLRDLESPGGTFVNRQRVLPGQSRPLQPGDVIQLGGVQLKVVAAEAPVIDSARTAVLAGPFVYPIPSGPTCRSWDDVLTASAQRWDVLREELVSGRLESFLASIGREDLAPKSDAARSPDERLDAWLGRLPTIKPAQPELDVHPARLVIPVTPGGGMVRRSVQVANVGLRLLKSSARIEPPGVTWVKLAPPFHDRPFVTIAETELALDVTIPDRLPAPLLAELVIDGNGGSKRVKLILEAKTAPADVFGATAATLDEPAVGLTFSELIARQSPLSRVVTWSFGALVVRLLVGVASGSLGPDALVASGGETPGLLGVAVMLSGLGAFLGGWLASRRGGSREIPTGGFAGGCAGVVVSATLVAACRSIEPILGPWSTSVSAVCGLWALIGSALAGVSILFVKGKT